MEYWSWVCAGREKYGEVVGEDGGSPMEVNRVSRGIGWALMREGSSCTAIILDADGDQRGAERR